MEQYTRVVGIDPSLTGSGICTIEFNAKELTVTGLQTFKSVPPAHSYARIGRYRGIVDHIFGQTQNCLTWGHTFVCIEGYSFLARGSAVTAMPELGALLRNRAQDFTIPWIEFSPSSIKKYGTGNGAAKKDLVMMAVHQRLGHLLAGTGFELKDSNQADAFVIAIMGADYARWKQHGVTLSKEHAELFKKMEKERFHQLYNDGLV